MTRVTVDEARALWKEASDEELKRLAQAVRARWHSGERRARTAWGRGFGRLIELSRWGFLWIR